MYKFYSNYIKDLKIVAYALALLVILSFCKKETTLPSNLNLTEKEKRIVSHGWRCVIKILGETEIKVDQFNPWELDDCWIFKSDKTYIYSYGSLRFPPRDQQDLKGIWYLSENESLLNYDALFPVKIEKITPDTLILAGTTIEGLSWINTYVSCSK